MKFEIGDIVRVKKNAYLTRRWSEALCEIVEINDRMWPYTAKVLKGNKSLPTGTLGDFHEKELELV